MRRNITIPIAIIVIIMGLYLLFVVDNSYINVKKLDSLNDQGSIVVDESEELIDKEANSEQKILRIGVMDYSPYQYMDGEEAKGISIDILKTALDELGYDYQFLGRPWSRILEEAESGKIDIFMDSYDVFSRRSFVSYSEYPLSSYTISIYKNKNTDLSYDGTFRSLKNYTFGSIRDYNYSTQITNAIEDGIISSKNTDTPEDNFLNLEKCLTDYTIEDKIFGDRFLIESTFNNIVEEPVPYDNRYTFFAFVNTPEMIDIRHQVNDLMKKYYQDGTVEKIYNKYDLEDSYKVLKVAMAVSPPIKRVDYATQTEPVRIGVLNYTPPFSYKENNELKGLYIDLISEAMDRTHIKYEFVELPFARILELTKTGIINIGVDIFINEDRKSKGIFLEEYPIAEYAYALCSKTENNTKFDGDINSLRGKTLGIVRGYSLGQYDYLYKDDGFIFDFTDDTNKLIKNLVNDRVDYAIEVKSTALISLKELGLDNYVKIEENFELSNLSYLYFSDSDFNKALMDELGFSLNEMKNDGTIKKLFERYDMLDAMPRVYE